MGRTRIRRGVLAVVAAGGLLLTGAGACDDGGDAGPGVGESGESGDESGYGTGGDSGAGEEGSGEPGEGGAGDEVGGGG
ncbi:hypothetical protein [Pseudonocardia nigra]|uniref:hypothetical protein n=1 Tax=Pseudonocardia nigra TaxID=1921578 RepID=UPI001C5D00E3|nr:hypothetical protein [Pseudonocardia nigra]